MPRDAFRIGVLISGGGTTLRNLIAKCESSELAARIACVLSSNPKAAGNEIAVAHDLPLHVVQRQVFPDTQVYSNKVFEVCRGAEIDLVVMGGFLKHLLIPADFENRVVNIHPALIPAFSGKGFYGRLVHQAVIQYGCKITGCTVHFVDNQYDHGPIIAQRCVDVHPGDTPESLQQRVFEQECALYPEVIQWIVDGRVRLDRRTVLVN